MAEKTQSPKASKGTSEKSIKKCAKEGIIDTAPELLNDTANRPVKTSIKLKVALVALLSSFVILVVKGAVEGLGHLATIGVVEHSSTATDQSPQSNLTIRKNAGGVTLGNGNSIGAKQPNAAAPKNGIPPVDAPKNPRAELTVIEENQGPVIVGDENVINSRSILDTQIERLFDRRSRLRQQVEALPNQRSKRVLQSRIETVDLEAASISSANDINGLNETLDVVEAKLNFLHGNYDLAEDLLKSHDTAIALLQLFEIQCYKREFAAAVKTSTLLEGDSIPIRVARICAALVSKESSGIPLSLQKLSELIVECEMIAQLARSTSDVDIQFQLLDLTNHESCLLGDWLDQSSFVDEISDKENPFSTAANRSEAVHSAADFVEEMARRRSVVIAKITAAGEHVPRGAVVTGFANQSGACHSALLALMAIPVTNKQTIAEWHKTAAECDVNLAALIQTELDFDGLQAAVDHAMLRFQFAARSFERGDLQLASEQIEPLIKELNDPGIDSRLSEDLKDGRWIGWAAIQLTKSMEMDASELRKHENQDVIRMSSEVIHKHRTKEVTFPFHKIACCGLLTLTGFSSEAKDVERLLETVRDFLRISDDEDTLRRHLADHVIMIESADINIPDSVSEELLHSTQSSSE